MWKACRIRHSHSETQESQRHSLETISIRYNPFAKRGWSSSAVLQFEMGLSAVAASSFILRLQVPASIENIQGRQQGRVAQSINSLRKQPRQDRGLVEDTVWICHVIPRHGEGRPRGRVWRTHARARNRCATESLDEGASRIVSGASRNGG